MMASKVGNLIRQGESTAAVFLFILIEDYLSSETFFSHSLIKISQEFAAQLFQNSEVGTPTKSAMDRVCQQYQ